MHNILRGFTGDDVEETPLDDALDDIVAVPTVAAAIEAPALSAEGGGSLNLDTALPGMAVAVLDTVGCDVVAVALAVPDASTAALRLRCTSVHVHAQTLRER